MMSGSSSAFQQHLQERLRTHPDNTYARIIKGKLDADFEHISSNVAPFPFIMGPETISALVGKSTRDIFNFIGYEDSHLKRTLEEGNHYRIVLFSAVGGMPQELRAPLPATWENVFALVRNSHPGCSAKLKPHWHEVKTQRYEEFTVNGRHIDSLLPEDYAVATSFEAFASSEEYNTASHARAFLRHSFKLMKLFSGDGYSYSEDGQRGAREYLVPRCAVQDLVEATPLISLTEDLLVAYGMNSEQMQGQA